MRTRDNDLRENAKFLAEMDLNIKTMRDDKLAKKQKEREEFLAQLDRYRKQAETKKLKRVALSESIYNEYLSDALKAIYITALGPISARGESIAINCVENYIQESNGARSIMRKNAGKTYLLDTVFEAVQKAHDIELAKALEEEALLEAEEKKVKDDTKGKEDDVEFDFGMDDENTEDFKPADDQPQEGETSLDTEQPAADNKEEKKEEPPVDDNAPKEMENGVDTSDAAVDDLVDKTEDDSAADGELDTDAEDQAEENQEDQAQGDGLGMDSEAEKARQDATEDNLSPEEVNSKEDMFKQLDDEDEVHNAIDIIATRIQDAEAEFVRKNADDKQKIEAIVNKLSDRIQAATKDPEEVPMDDFSAQPAQESALLVERYNLEAARQIKEVYNKRVKSVFEVMVSDISEHILKTQILREDYIEDGKLDMSGIIEDARVTYGFLEFVNTIQLEKVDEKFIKNYLNKNF